MNVQAGSRLGQYVVGERVSSTDSSEWFEASEAGLERPVSVLAAPLPEDAAAVAEVRERARRLAGLSDARLLPVYGQGEDGDVLWLATRRVVGQRLSDLGRLDERRAARLGTQLAEQLAALQEAGVVPVAIEAGDVVVEESGGQERAWLIPDPARPVAANPTTATASLVRLLDERVGRPLLADAPSDPQSLTDKLGPLAAEPTRRRGLLLAAVAVVVAAVAIGVAIALTQGNAHKSAPAASTPVARVAARIPLGGAFSSIAFGTSTVWATTGNGALIRIDPNTNRVVGAPVRLFPKNSYPRLASRGGILWTTDGLVVDRLSPGGRVLARTKIAHPPLLNILPGDGVLSAMLLNGPTNTGRVLQFDPMTLKQRYESGSFGDFPILAGVAGRTAWAVNNNDGSLSRVDPSGQVKTIAAGSSGRGGITSGGRVWIPTYFDRTLVAVDPKAMTIAGFTRFGQRTDNVTSGAGSIWVLTDSPSLLYRVDPATYRILGKPIPVPNGATALTFGLGSLWVDDPAGKAVVRLTPTMPAPAARPAAPAGDVLQNGPIQPGRRLRVNAVKPPFSVVVPDRGWIAEGVPLGSVEITELNHHTAGLAVETPTQVFQPGGRLAPVHSAEDFLAALRRIPHIQVSHVTSVKIGGLTGLRVRVTTNPKPPISQSCPGVPCVLVFPINHGVYLLTKAVDDFTFVKRGPVLFLVDASYGNHLDPAFIKRVRRLVASIRFEKATRP